ncbi:MFS family permease [Peribacillus deserti]|uniref:MFS family permease n=1 Tax=Peribacillus deserti TaxID=673318 RepID=A0ABS2QJT8_9BACI|nr:MFS transporter [Peribacillus deserti]MBM7693411.1 MFS family permease [Peribacillus deserti]
MSLSSNEKASIYSGLAQTISINTVNGYIPLLALGVLGASNQQMGLITSLPSIIGMIALIPGAILLNRVQSKKNFTVISTFATRFLFMLIFFIPFFSDSISAWLLVFLIALLNFPGALANLSWQTMIGEIIPEKRRGDFFSTRNRINNIAALIVTFGTGFFLEQYSKDSSFPYQILILAGFAFALIEVYYLSKHKEELTIKPVQEKPKRKFSLEVFKHKPYTAFLACALLYNFAAQMAWSLFSIYQIKDAHATALWLSIFAVTNQAAQILSIKWWAKYADKYGNTMVLFIAAAGMASAPALNMLSTNLLYITAINFWTGIFVAGTNLLLFNQLLKASPEKNRANYIANYNFLLSFVGFAAPQLGVLILNHAGMHSAMNIISLIRLGSAFSFLVVALKMERRRIANAFHFRFR